MFDDDSKLSYNDMFNESYEFDASISDDDHDNIEQVEESIPLQIQYPMF